MKKFLLLFGLFYGANAYAYIDLGSGSFVLQIVIASFFAAIFTVKSYFNNLKMKIKGYFSKNTEDKTLDEKKQSSTEK